jgi:predicted  nucleic acid-binding Zn-ribbon protein
MKTNMDYLKELIEGNEEALEFWEAVRDEITDLNDEVSNLEEEVEDKESKITKLENELLNTEFEGEVIDCGIGTIEYRTDNLKLQSIMEDFKEQLEHKAKFGVLPDSVSV